MKRTFLFKSLIDTLFFFLCFGLLGIIIILPFGSININHAQLKLEGWNGLHWSVFILSLLAYIVFITAIYQLRKVAHLMLKNKIFSASIAKGLKKSGKLLISSGCVYILTTLLMWIANLFQGEISFMYDSGSMTPLFIIIIGVFFMIQSEVLLVAKTVTDENNLTI